ncbi:hypothetical protein A6X20_07220 [Bradyrhizobium elkanii]|nr:hypothetical protein A6X20_07220 [Bradyrhizobium elkanii]ODM79097.1 hypothetical protein A6452_28805 [Bradyrhizobium elkanii]
MSQTELARQLTGKLGREIDKAGVNKIVKSGERSVAGDELMAIEEITGVPVPSPHVSQVISLLDWVQAGQLAHPNSQIPEEDVEKILFAGLPKGEWFALTVKGSSMDRVSPEGSVIIVNKADKDLVTGGFYVFQTPDEGATYKRWHGGDTPYLAPWSWDGSHQPIFIKKKRDVEVVGRVRRTLLDL